LRPFIVSPKQIKIMQLIACLKPRLPGRGIAKTWLLMKLTVLFLLAACINASATGYAQKVNLTENDVPLKKVFQEIKKQTGYTFVYTRALLEKAGKVTISVKNASLEQALDACLEGQPLSYTIFNKMVIIKVANRAPKTETEKVVAASPAIVITGKVANDKGEPLGGASITEKGTSNAVTAKDDGHFSINVSATNAVLVITYVGYVAKEVKLNNTEPLSIVLSPDVQGINEVVVVGFGTQKKSDLTGAVASANLEAFRDAPNTNIAQSLQGTVAGLNIGQVNRAGTTPTINVRGRTTINGNANTLIVLDGIQYTGSLADINPDDVATIDVLKDASSAAVYGAQAANGVLIITTRKGKNNQKARISFSSSYATQTPTGDLRPLNRQEFLDKVRDLHYNEAFTGPDYTTPNPAFNLASKVDATMKDASGNILDNDFNWWDAATRTGHIQDYQLSVSGGAEKVNYLISAGLTDQKGFIINDIFKRKSIRVNLETQPTNWWKLGIQSFGSFSNYSGAEPEMRGIIRHAPLLVPYDDNGDLIPSPTQTVLPNPFMTYDVDDYERRNNLFANIYSEIKIPFITGLTYRINYGNNYRIEKHYEASQYGAGLTGSASRDDGEYYDYTLDNIVTYQRDFGKHGLTATLLYGAIEREYSQSISSATGFSRLTLGYNSLEQGAIRNVNSNAWSEALNYQMGRINYRFDDRYLLTATIRRDGFSGFAANEKHASFPSVALGWNIHNESFLNADWVNVLKLRASYGSNGNLTSRYYSLAAMQAGTAYVFGDGGTTLFGQQVETLANPNLRWEKTTGVNIGTDFTLLNNRISGSIDYYNNKTNDLLFDVSIPAVTGFTIIRTNVGNVKNKGIELSLTSTNLQYNNFEWSTSLNISRNTNKIVKLVGLDANGDGVEDDLVASNLFIGKSIETIYQYQTDGLYQLNDVIPAGYYPGTFRIVDQTKDNNITTADRIILGRQEPAYRFSILNTFRYGGFTLRVFLNAIQGGKNGYLGSNFNNIGSVKDDNGIKLNYLSDMDYWSPNNPNAEYPRSLVAPAITPGVYKDRSFVRLQDVTLSYSFSKNILNKLGIQNLSVYLSGKNLATWTKWKGWDPETGQGLIDNGGRPVMKGYAAGLNLNF
jgi:TonB-dependent starch-binding outer membrane protein SusC